jgi:ABC-2 type transport system permease protein
MTAFTAQVGWEIKRQFRNKRFIFLALLIPLFYYFLFAHLNGASMKISGTQWSKYFMMSMATFSIIGAAIYSLAARMAFERTQGWTKLIQTTPLEPSTYMGSKIIGQIVIGLSSICVIFLAAVLGQGVRMAPWQWLDSSYSKMDPNFLLGRRGLAHCRTQADWAA